MPRLLTLLTAAVAVLLTACGAPTGSGASSPPKPAAGALGGAAPAAPLNPAPAVDAPAAPPDAEPITFGLDWITFGRHAAYFVALDKGWYAGEGLAVNIVRGYGGTDAIKRVAAGTVQFALGDTGSLVLARANDDVRVKAIAMVYARAPHLLFYFNDRGINSPKDLEGRTITMPATSAVTAFFPAFARATGIDANRVSWQHVDPTTIFPLVMAGTAEVSGEFLPAMPVLEKQAADAGRTLASMRYADHGVDFYSSAVMATEAYLAEKPDVARRFVAATLRGLAYAFENPDEAATIQRKYNPELDAAISRQEIAHVERLAWSDEARANGLGYMSLERMRVTRDVTAGAFELKKPVEPEELFTNEFLPRR